MDAKEIKEALKEAREEIRNKDYKKALKICKNILKADKDNYNALVFIGVAAKELDQTDQAIMAFQRAIALSPEQLLAWQGLNSLYEKSDNPEHKKELLRVLEKLIQLSARDGEKLFNLYEKYSEILFHNGNLEQCISALKEQLEIANGDVTKEIQVHKAFMRVLTLEPVVSSDALETIEVSLEKCLNTNGDGLEVDGELKTWFKHYLNALRKNGSLNKAALKSWKMHKLFPNCNETLEILCDIHLQIMLEGSADVNEEVEIIAQKLLEANPNNNTGKMLILACAFNHKQWQKVVDCLSAGISAKHTNECQLVIKCYEVLHQHEEILKLATKGLTLCEALPDSDPLKASFHLSLLASRYHIVDEKAALEDIELLEKILQMNHSSSKLSALLLLNYLKIGNVEVSRMVLSKYTNLFNEHEKAGYEGLIFKAEEKLDLAISQLKKALQESPEDVYFLLELALVYRTLQDYSNSLPYLLMAAKLDTYNPKLFYEIGNHYKLMQDIKKAQRCYAKAFSLSPNNEVIGKALSDSYHSLNQRAENLKLLIDITSRSESLGSKWAWVRLGLCHLTDNDTTAAIKAFQNALRINPLDSYCWEALADAYMTRGSYKSAYKSYSKVLEMNPEFAYCSFQMANIKQLIQEYAEAAADYKAVLDKHKDYVPALKGCSEVFLHQAKEYLRQYLHGLAKDCCIKAIHMLEKAVNLRSDLVCLWKLLGDACTLTFSLPSKISYFEIPSSLLSSNEELPDMCTLSKDEILNLGARCYGRALALLPESSGLWHDIGINYFYHSNISSDTNDYCEKAIMALKKAVCLEPTNLMHWNALGVISIAVKNYALSQHCFIKAINNERLDPTAWTNLGILYLINDKLELANQAFSVAQSIEPLYLNSWIGQATIAEKVKNSDSMDLFRHAVDVAHHDEGGMGYAHWVIKTILKSEAKETDLYKYWVENMAAIPAACDCMAKFTDQNEDNCLGFNMYGLLLEKENLHNLALKALRKALELSQRSNENSFIQDQVHANYARVLLYLGHFKESYNYFNEIKEPDIYTQSGLALSYFKAGCYSESYEAYDAALHWFAKTDEEKSHLLVAMALVAYKQGDLEKAKTLLFQSSQSKPVSVSGLFALCAIGLLHHESEITLAFAALQELLPHHQDSKYSAQITFLITALSVVQNKLTFAKNQLCKSIHKQPTDYTLWRLLSHQLLSQQENLEVAEIAALAAQKLNTLSVPVNYLTSVLKNIDGECLICYSSLLLGKLDCSLRSSQKALHSNPGDIANWCGFVAAVTASNYHRKNFKYSWIQTILGIIERLMYIEKTCTIRKIIWIKWYRILIALACKDRKLIKKIEEEISKLISSKDIELLKVNNLLCASLKYEESKDLNLTAFTDETKENMNKSLQSFSWQILVKSSWASNLISEAEKIITQWISFSEPFNRQKPILALAYLYQAKSLFQFSPDKTKNVHLEECLKKLERLDSSNVNVPFIRALNEFPQNNTKHVIKNLKKVLERSPNEVVSWTTVMAEKILATL